MKNPGLLRVIISLLFALTFLDASSQKVDVSQLKQLKYRHIGPLGNRVISVVGISGDPLTYYVGAASGGI